MLPRSTMGRTLRSAARVGAVGLGYAALNLVAAGLQTFPGVSMVYPASAFGVVMAFLWPAESAIGVFFATLLTPWSEATPLWLQLCFSLGNTVEAVVPALVLGPRQHAPDYRVMRRFFLFACAGNTLLNIALAFGPQVLAGMRPLDLQLVREVGAWWIADGMAVAVFGLPFLLWLRPELFVEDRAMLSWSFVREPMRIASIVAYTVAISAGVFFYDRAFLASFNWPALLFLVPLTLALAHGGLEEAVSVNAVIAGAYMATIVFGANGGGLAALRSSQQLTAVYGNLVLFLMLAVVAGTIRTRNLTLLRQLQNRWKSLRESFEATVRTLAAAIEATDPFTEQHVERVSSYAEAIARRMNLPEEEVEIIRYGAILHDVGKIGVPSHLLRKSEPITNEEYREIKRHVEAGAKLLERTGLLEEAIPLVRYHDERWDGRTDGRYAAVHGLKGEDIPLGARIITVADAFDAMTSDRPYRRSLGIERAAAELHAEAGKQFDPEVVRVFLRMMREQGYDGVPSSGPLLPMTPVGDDESSGAPSTWS